MRESKKRKRVRGVERRKDGKGREVRAGEYLGGESWEVKRSAV
jgi:hypothetical protein